MLQALDMHSGCELTKYLSSCNHILMFILGNCDCNNFFFFTFASTVSICQITCSVEIVRDDLQCFAKDVMNAEQIHYVIR